jgi:hypothetical protein
LLFNLSQNSSAKVSIIFQETSLNVLQHFVGKSFKWHQLKNENFQVSQIGFFFFPNNFFLNIIDIETQRLTSAGIMSHLLNLVFKDKYSNVSIKEWKVLTLENLRFGFVIWLWSCAVAVVAFLVEGMIWMAIKRAKRSLHGYVHQKWNQLPVIYPVTVRMSDKQC